MMKTAAFAVARRLPVRRAVMVAPNRSMSTVRSWVQYWWPSESREFDINHEKIREDSTLAAAAAPAEPVVEMTIDEMTLAAEQASVEEKVVVEDQSWWPHETRDFDVDHDNEAAKLLCEKTKLKVTIPK
uniref:Uncharacterized protein n=1 Tax=Amphora coffeiformis TaxID=265554 RepID=A0A7S3LG97_9STRA|mmetsp:Transcript_13499/g.25747  ORF Transcript_13499/g.25747 Transcript_13499/m.25747 type:complete len:129 (+) Transcript_13499:156-542(+)